MSARRLVGTVEGVQDSVLLFRQTAHNTATPIRLAQIERVEVSDGKKSNAGTGAIVGSVLLGGTATVLALVLTSDGGEAVLGSEDIPAMVGIGVAGGALLGALIGSTSHSERWKQVSRDRLRVAMTLNPGRGIGLRLSLAR